MFYPLGKIPEKPKEVGNNRQKSKSLTDYRQSNWILTDNRQLDPPIHTLSYVSITKNAQYKIIFAVIILFYERYLNCNSTISFRKKLPGNQEVWQITRRWCVLDRPGWRKPFQCIPSLLWHDVIRRRMDYVLHHQGIRQTQNGSRLPPAVSI